jgi:very-short-patch-repair endonuclease
VKPDIEDALRAEGGVLRRADFPKLNRRLDGMLRRGTLITPLPGIVCLPGAATDPSVALRAGWLWAGPDSVVTGRAAAQLTFWPDADVGVISYAVPRRRTVSWGRWQLSCRRMPPEYLWHRGSVMITSPAMTAVDLAVDPDGGDIIDRALRSRTATLEQMWEALRLCPDRPGNRIRAALLRDSRDEPWSESERALHGLLRKSRLTGWTTNCWLDLPNLTDRGGYVDVLFKRERLAIEVDGYEFHADREAFERDRRRRNELELAGYRVLNFTWRQILDDPDWVIDCIRRALALRS